MSERKVDARQYKGFTIETIEQDSGRKTYDIRDSNGNIVEWAAYNLSVAKATVNAILESNKG
ncbi:hypothetical protein FDI69_gp136 [Rhodococcus phage Trina]|uniref:Uncharacterized protein n=1 Tax=Rhodococcus phage Trina TaxID=2027905 RepID=A0A2D0ZN79_9CAUD|nr:hypothetical protein FDI69_gp136 [Rhodococcus phage Trina]ASZ75049.1 hypothetical protein SEA_TRINA_271 [Rhodococcus phage Trina]